MLAVFLESIHMQANRFNSMLFPLSVIFKTRRNNNFIKIMMLGIDFHTVT